MNLQMSRLRCLRDRSPDAKPAQRRGGSLTLPELRRAVLMAILALVSLTGCAGREVLGGLDGKQAAVLVNILNQMQIQADRESDTARGRNLYRIVVSEADYSRALALLSECIPPEDNSAELNRLTESSLGSVLSPEMQALKFDRTLALEIERLLNAFPGVMYSRVKVSSKYGGAARTGSSGVSASVVIRYASLSGNVPFREEDVRQTVEQVVSGIQPKDLKISIDNAIPTKFFQGAPPPTVENRKDTVLLVFLGVAVSVVLGILIGYLFARRGGMGGRSSRIRKQTDKVRVGEGLR